MEKFLRTLFTRVPSFEGGLEIEMITVHVQILGVLTKPCGKRKFDAPCSEGTTVSEFLKALRFTEEHIGFIKVFINGKEERSGYIIRGECTIVLTTAAGGG